MRGAVLLLVLAGCAPVDQRLDAATGTTRADRCQAAQVALTLAQIAVQPFPGREPDQQAMAGVAAAQAVAAAICAAPA